MTDSFDKINARQFMDFKCLNNDEDDTFFDNHSEDETLVMADSPVANKGESLVITDDPLAIAREDCIQQQGIEKRTSDLSSSSTVHSVIILDDDDDDDHDAIEENGDGNIIGYHSSFNEDHQFRRSMSVGDIFYLEMAQENQRVWESEDTVSSSSTYDNNQQKNASKVSSRKFSPIKRQFASDRNLNSYVPLAEAIRNFQIHTPERFRSRSKPDLRSHTEIHSTKPTVPQSPHLVCNKRHRPLNVLSREEEELKEYEEAQKFKFKAHPVNKKVLQKPFQVLPHIAKKPTVPQPFHLAPVKPKVDEEPPNKAPEFHAKSAPDFSQKPQLKKPLYQKLSTKPQTPKFMRRLQKKQDKSLKPNVLEPIKPKPYPIRSLPLSFELRNQYLQERKEKFVNQFIEDEKKAREFHARPIPKHILTSPKINKSSTKTVELRSKVTEQKLKTMSTENLSEEVKPKPAKIVKRPLTEIQEFRLMSDLRAKERKAFDEELKAKYDKIEQLKQLNEEKRFKEEQEEIIRLRKLAEVKAQPIKKYKQVHIQPSGQVTEPISPKFHSLSKKGDKENENNYEKI